MKFNKPLVIGGTVAAAVALALVYLAHQSAAAAQAAASNSGSNFPNLLFAAQPATTPSSADTADLSNGVSSAPSSSDAAITAALTLASQQIAATQSMSFNTNTDQLLAGLPTALSQAGITTFTASPTDTGGVTASVTYNQPGSVTQPAPSVTNLPSPPSGVQETIQPSTSTPPAQTVSNTVNPGGSLPGSGYNATGSGGVSLSQAQATAVTNYVGSGVNEAGTAPSYGILSTATTYGAQGAHPLQ